MKLAACVIIYNADNVHLKNILSYIDAVDFLFIVDNSTQNNVYDFSFLDINKYIYINNHGNLGIAAALNIAAQKAKNLGFEWLLTMDQDSCFKKKSVGVLKNTLKLALSQHKNVAIISPIHLEVEINDIQQGTNKLDDYKTADEVITSGNIVSLAAWAEVGCFNEALFIDSVDTDFCFRLVLTGYHILIANNSYLVHPLGDAKTIKVFGWNIQTSRHSYIRRYYMTRNINFIAANYSKQFKEHCKFLRKKQFIDLIKIILFEDEKIKKAKYFLWGIWDYNFNKYGKFDH